MSQGMRENGDLCNHLNMAHHSLGTLLARLKPWGEASSLVVDNLRQHVETTKSNAEQVSFQVRIIDLERSRVLSVIKAIEDAREITQCAETFHKALLSENYEEAAEAVEAYLSLMKEDRNYVLSPKNVGESEERSPILMLKAASRDFCDLVRKRFDQALLEGDSKSMPRFFRIFPRIGQGQYGLDRYGEHLMENLKKSTDAQLRSSSLPLSEGNHGRSSAETSLIKLCIRLFETVAKIVDENESFVEQIYGAGRMIYIIWKLWKGVDKQAFMLFTIYLYRVDLEKHVKIARAALRYGKSCVLPDEAVKSSDGSELDLVLSQLTLWNRQVRLYFRFMELRAKNAISRLQHCTENPNLAMAKRDASSYDALPKELFDENGLRKHSEFDRKLQDIMNDYLTLEQHFAKSAVEKAISIDVYSEKDSSSGASSSVDDVFCIFRKSTLRALSSADVDTFCAMTNLILGTLEVDYWSCLLRRASSEDTSLYPSASMTISSLVCLNNMDVSCEYLRKLRVELESEAKKLFEEEGERVLIKIRSCLTEYNDAAIQLCKHSIQNALHDLFRHYIQNSLKACLEQDLKDARYLLSEDSYLEIEVSGDSLGRHLVASLRKMFLPIRRSLTPRNFECLIGNVLDYLLKEYERFVFSSKFTALGAAQFDNDIRQLSVFFGNLVGFSVFHDRFNRLYQISAIINVDQPSDVVELLSSTSTSPLTWRLTRGQVLQLLGRRTEFELDNINKLVL